MRFFPGGKRIGEDGTMIEKKEVIAFFDRLAPQWDAEMVRSDEIIGKILDNAGVKPGADVLDVATGTGVLIPDYLGRGVRSVTGIDLSPEMIRAARAKFSQPNVTFLCGDVEEWAFDRQFDCVVVYNAFPHFPDPARLIGRLSALVRPGGTLTVAHGMSRERINGCHQGPASHVSMGLLPAEELARLFAAHLTVTRVLSDDRMYQVTGFRPAD